MWCTLGSDIKWSIIVYNITFGLKNVVLLNRKVIQGKKKCTHLLDALLIIQTNNKPISCFNLLFTRAFYFIHELKKLINPFCNTYLELVGVQFTD